MTKIISAKDGKVLLEDDDGSQRIINESDLKKKQSMDKVSKLAGAPFKAVGYIMKNVVGKQVAEMREKGPPKRRANMVSRIPVSNQRFTAPKVSTNILVGKQPIQRTVNVQQVRQVQQPQRKLPFTGNRMYGDNPQTPQNPSRRPLGSSGRMYGGR